MAELALPALRAEYVKLAKTIMGSVLAVALGIVYLSPPLELMPPGALTRFERFRRRWRWFVGVVVVAVIGAVVTKVLD